MFCELTDLFEPAELAELLNIAATAQFVDGRISNPANNAKDNLQLHDQIASPQSAKIVTNALFRQREFVDFALPKIMAPPMITKYEIGMQYGTHSDAAFLPLRDRPLRTDLSATIFLADPASYDGGELSVQTGSRTTLFKGPAGSVIVYPSNTLHAVLPVTRGVRIAAITFIESQIREQHLRELYFELSEVAALEGLQMAPENYTRLQRVKNSLQRSWSDAG